MPLGTALRVGAQYSNFRGSMLDVADQRWMIEPVHADRFGLGAATAMEAVIAVRQDAEVLA